MSALNIYNLCSRTARDIDNWIMFKKIPSALCIVHYILCIYFLFFVFCTDMKTPRWLINKTLSAVPQIDGDGLCPVEKRRQEHCLHTTICVTFGWDERAESQMAKTVETAEKKGQTAKQPTAVVPQKMTQCVKWECSIWEKWAVVDWGIPWRRYGNAPNLLILYTYNILASYYTLFPK